MGRTALLKAVWNGQVELVKVLLEHPDIDINIIDSSERTPLHMAAWGQYGGRLLRKASINPEDSPECCILLLARGASPNSRDIYGVTPLGTCCGTGGVRCMDMLVEAGADVNNVDLDGCTALHLCFYRGNIEPLDKLIKYKARTDLKNKAGKTAFECVFIDDMGETLNHVLFNREFIKAAGKDPWLTVTADNIELFFSQAMTYKAQGCYEVLLKYQKENKLEINIDFSDLFARTLTIYNTTFYKDKKDQRINTDMLEQLNDVDFQKWHLDKDQKLTDAPLSPHFELSLSKVLLALIVSRQLDDKVIQIFKKNLLIFNANYVGIPVFLLKACFMHRKNVFIEEMVDSGKYFDYTKDMVPLELISAFEPPGFE